MNTLYTYQQKYPFFATDKTAFLFNNNTNNGQISIENIILVFKFKTKEVCRYKMDGKCGFEHYF